MSFKVLLPDGQVGINNATSLPPTDQLKLDRAELSVGARCGNNSKPLDKKDSKILDKLRI